MTNSRACTIAFTAALVAFTLAMATVSANPLQAAGAAQQPAATQKPALDITLVTTPTPPKAGSNTLEVMVKGADGKPITDGEVTAMFYMAATPNMSEMKNTVTLKHQKGGTYSGTGQVMMAGKWDVTVTVKRDGKEIGSKKIPVTAK